MLRGKKIVIGITGSIAAYKIPYLIRLFIKEGAEVKIIMTPAARHFVTPLTLSTLSRNNVVIDPFEESTGEWNNHVELGTWADVVLFAPVTANTLGKMAHGIADNFLITVYLSAKCPVFIAPAMDLDMFNHPTTQKNISILQSYGNFIIEPQIGELASGLSGPGRMEEPETILEIIKAHFKRKMDLTGKKVLVTAGPTYEMIDPVRFIGNFSSGLMGFSIAEEAASRGAEVTLITGPSQLKCSNPSIHRLDITSASEMHKACIAEYPKADITIMSAAVSDYTARNPKSNKIKKGSGKLTIELSPTFDILQELGDKKRTNQILVGFALETENEMGNARKKLLDKKLDLIIMNSLKDKGAGFQFKTNKVTMIDSSGKIRKSQLKNKKEVAKDILDAIIDIL